MRNSILLSAIIRQIATTVLLLQCVLSSLGQINCTPVVGDFFRIEEGANIRKVPSLSSEVWFKMPEKRTPLGDFLSFTCTLDGLEDGFIQVGLRLLRPGYDRLGLNKLQIESIARLLEEKAIIAPDWKKLGTQELHEHAQTWFDMLNLEEWYHDALHEASEEELARLSDKSMFIAELTSVDLSNPDVLTILETARQNVYIHKSVVSTSGFFFLLENRSSEYYFGKIREILAERKEDRCAYSDSKLLGYLKKYTETLFQEEKYFEALQFIAKFEELLTEERHLLTIEALKLKASYFDGNCLSIHKNGMKIINAYKRGDVTNTEEDNHGDVDMSTIYGMVVSCLLKSDKYQTALPLSSECNKNPALRHEQYVFFHAAILANLQSEKVACEYLNEMYQKGSESARSLLLEKCQ